MFAPKRTPMKLKAARRRIKLIGKNHVLYKSLKHYIHETKCRNQKSKKWKQRRVKQFRLKKFKMPRISKTYPRMISEELASVQPISLDTNTLKHLFHFDFDRSKRERNE